MKRFGFTLMALVLAAGILSGCDANANKTPLIYGQYQGELVALSYEQLTAKINNDDNFVVFQTPSSACTCWTSFRDTIITPYIEDNHIRIFTVPFGQFYNVDNTKRDTYGITLSASSPTLAIYKDGNLKVMREYNSTHKIWASSDSFITYINELVINPTIIDITLENLNNLYIQTASFSLVYYDENSESTFLRQKFLKAYALDNSQTKNNLYALNTNVEGIKLDVDNDYNEGQWQAFKDAHGLSALNNVTYGWDNGFVPTFQYIEPNGVNTNGSVIKSQAVYLNDTLIDTESMNHFQIASSYYKTDRVSALTYLNSFTGTKVIEGLIIADTDTELQGTTRRWTFEKAAVYHDPLLRAFLDENLPKTTYIPA